jgi:hypothetical protein
MKHYQNIPFGGFQLQMIQNLTVMRKPKKLLVKLILIVMIF